jgi:putative DNA methylase
MIEVALPLEAINQASAREKSIRHGHPSTLHLWWARRPLAAARAVLFGQLVDDPSSWPEEFATPKAQEKERQRLFRLIEQLVKWENSNNETVINAARLEIARSHARSSTSPKAKAILGKKPAAEIVNEYLATELPPVHDPFAGGGTIPLEAQRLGLRAIASDLNPVAVLINKALIEIPPKFAGRPPVNPDARSGKVAGTWTGARGLADDVRYYGAWMRDEARKRIGGLYADVELPKEHGGGKATVIAWLWARTVPSPDPAFGGVSVPLVSSFWLSTRKGDEAWLEPVVDGSEKTWWFAIACGKTPRSESDRRRISEGTKTGRGDFRCILSGSPMPASYIRAMGQAGNLGSRLIAVVAEGARGRIYLPATKEIEDAAAVTIPDGAPTTDLPEQALGFRVQNYGLRRHRDLFTPRQLVALTTLSELVAEAHEKVTKEARENGRADADALAHAIATYLALGVGKFADNASALCSWHSGASHLKIRATFGRQALPMVWDFAEGNAFSDSTGNFFRQILLIAKVLEVAPPLQPAPEGVVLQADAACPPNTLEVPRLFSTDPPYYDNVPYADLSDFFYVWLRMCLKRLEPAIFATVLVPKAGELIVEPSRHPSRSDAERFFLDGIRRALTIAAAAAGEDYPIAVYYAFKQTERDAEGAASTGWETFLGGMLSAGFSLTGTWPTRTELSNRMRGQDSNALASSIVLVGRKRLPEAQVTTRAEFRRLLHRELPEALRLLQEGNIAPVDLPQASIGPGMAIFSRYSKVLEPDGSPMTVRTALQLINEALDEYLTEQEGDFEGYTRFALTWYDQHRWDAGAFGDAENLAKARNVAVDAVQDAGFLHAKAGKVRLLKRSELSERWDPLRDSRATVWEATQHLIKRLETEGGEQAAAELLARLGPMAQPARDLAYRLYTLCERKKWADDAQAYNALVVAWPELQKLAAERPKPTQENLL